MSARTRLLGDAAKIVDARSSRSRQRKVGASEIGVCRRRAGYSHHGVKPSNPENVTGLPAIAGTWMHKGALATMKAEWGTLIETTVEDDLIRGHVDGLDLPNHLRVAAGLAEIADAPEVPEVDDLKTKRDGRMVEYVRNRGPKRSELFQTHIYADLLRRGQVKPLKRQAGLASLGPIPVEIVRLRYFARTGEENAEYVYEQPYDPEITREALAWAQEVKESKSPDELPRDQDGPGLSIVCDNCPFRTACWGEAIEGGPAPQSQLIVTDADLAAVLAEYDEQRAIERDAKARKDKARKILDATDPAIYTDGERAFKVGWSGGKMGDPKIDVDGMVALFKEAGLEVPYLAPRRSARTIQLTRWDAPETPCGKPVVTETHAPPYVEDAKSLAEGCERSAQIDRDEADTLDVDDPRRETVLASAARWQEYVDEAPSCVLKKRHSGDCQATVVDLDPDAETTVALDAPGEPDAA